MVTEEKKKYDFHVLLLYINLWTHLTYINISNIFIFLIVMEAVAE